MQLTVTMWLIWYARRQAIDENIFQSPLLTHSFVEHFIADMEMSTPQVERRGGMQAQVPHWILPPQGVTEVNIDAALSKNSRIVALAAIARDEAGIFQGASVVVLEGVLELEMAEAMTAEKV